MGYHGSGGWSGAEWVGMALMMAAFWGVAVALVVWLVRSLSPHPLDEQRPDRARAAELLAERFAVGEIDDDEYRRRRDVLIGSGASGADRRT